MCDENNDCGDIGVPIHFNNANIDCVDDGVQKVVDITSENNCIIEDVDNACVEMPSDEIGVKEHDNFCDEPYDDSFDHNCGEAHIENVVGNVDCVVDNVHANLLENVGDINAKRDDDICDNSSNACKNATYDLHNNNEVNFLNPYDFNDSDSFDSSDDDDGNCVDTCENNSFNSNDNDGLESFTFDDNSLLNEHVGELHDMLCDVDDELNVDAKKEEKDGDLRDLLLSSEKEEEKESVIIEKENEEQNFENKNVMIEEVHCKIMEEEKEKTRNESVREEVEEKVRNDEKEFGEKKENEKRGKLEDNSILMDMDSCQLWEESMLCIELKEFVNARHLRAYLEERVDGAKGLVSVQVCWNESLKVASSYGR
nr:hypothetical protein Iba_chr01bCG1620 [Ipomoea batatas]